MMAQTKSCAIGGPAAVLPEPCHRNDMIYRTTTIVQTFEIIPPEKIGIKIQPYSNWDARARSKKPRAKDSTQALLLSRQWMTFYQDLQTTSFEVQYQFFKLCAIFAPELAERTDEEWRSRFRELSDKAERAQIDEEWHNRFRKLLEEAKDVLTHEKWRNRVRKLSEEANQPNARINEEWRNRFRKLSEEVKHTRTDEEWRNLVREVSRIPTYNSSPLLLRLLFAPLCEGNAGSNLASYCELLERSANDNLAELRKLLGATKEEQITCDKLSLEDRIVRTLPIGFAKEVYESLPAALINSMPFKTVTRALCLMDQMVPHTPKPENKFRHFIYQCAVLREDGNSFRKWMASEEGKRYYLQARGSLGQLLTVSELALSLAVLRCYELVLDNDEDLRPEEEQWIIAFTMHLNGSNERPRFNLWNVVGSSFKRACHQASHPIAPSWLDTVLDETPSSSDKLVQTYWHCRLTHLSSALRQEASSNEFGSQPMQRQVSQRGNC